MLVSVLNAFGEECAKCVCQGVKGDDNQGDDYVEGPAGLVQA